MDKLLKGMSLHKAAGPDKFKFIDLQTLHKELALILQLIFQRILFYFFYYWHDRMRSLRQGVRIWNFEEKKKTETKQKQNKQKKQENYFGCVLTK